MPRTEHTLSRSAYSRRQLAVLSKALKRWMRDHAASPDGVATAVGCSAQQVRNLLKRDNAPSFALLMALGRMMGVDLMRQLKE